MKTSMRKATHNQSVRRKGEAFDLAGDAGHLVEAGECLHSLAEEHGFKWESLWNLPENEALKRAGREPHLLHPGDRLFIPAPRIREEDGATEMRHRFKRHGLPNKLRLRVLDDGKPLRNRAFEVDFGTAVQRGKSDGEGIFEVFIPKGARAARLRVGEGVERKTYELDLGALAPADGVSGVQARLNNLGYDTGAVDGRLGHNTRDALRRFQLHHKLKETGEPDADTVRKLTELHGS